MSLRNACERDFQEQERVTGNDCRHFFFYSSSSQTRLQLCFSPRQTFASTMESHPRIVTDRSRQSFPNLHGRQSGNVRYVNILAPRRESNSL